MSKVLVPTRSFITFNSPGIKRGSTRNECWEAASKDGTWVCERIEIPGTPWDLLHVPSGITNMYGSLVKAEKAVMSGYAVGNVGWCFAEAMIRLFLTP